MKTGIQKLIYTWNDTALHLAIILVKYDLNMSLLFLFSLPSTSCVKCELTESSSRVSPVMFTVSQITIVPTLNYLHKMGFFSCFQQCKVLLSIFEGMSLDRIGMLPQHPLS